jgi:hypothetical protein
MKRADRIIGILLLAFGIFIIAASSGLPPAPMKGTAGPGYVPRLLSILLICFASVLLLLSFRRREDRPILWEANSSGGLWGVMLLALLVPAGMAYGGFVLTCFLSSLVFCQILRVRLLSSFFLSAGITVGIYMVFHYGLQVQFPSGIF